MNIDTLEGMAAAIVWQQAWLSRIKEDGIWMVPRSATSIRISHAKKTATVTWSCVPERTIRRVFEAMGWKFVERQQAFMTNPLLS